MGPAYDECRCADDPPDGIRPRFSIVLPVYNRAATVCATLASVQAQTFKDFECVVVDDGSTDGELLRSVVDRLQDSRFRYVRRENGGGAAARNTGIEAARGDYIAFLDSDDLFLPEKLSVIAMYASDDPTVGFYSQALVDRGGSRRWIRPKRALRPDESMGVYLFVHNQFIPTPTIVIPSVAARKVMFDPGLSKGQDLDFCLRLDAAGVRFQMIEPPLTIWRDVAEENRTSRNAGCDDLIAWLARTKPLLTRRTVAGYKATVMAYHISKTRPFTAMLYLVNGLITAGVPASITVRQALRCFLPRRTYRSMVNLGVALLGRRRESGGEWVPGALGRGNEKMGPRGCAA